MGLSWRCLLQASLLIQFTAATQLTHLVARSRGDTTEQTPPHRVATPKPTLRPMELKALAELEAEPQFTPKQYLLASSRSEGTIVWCELKNFRWTLGQTFPLIDSGLVEPSGLAFDPELGNLYVADPGASSVYCYRLALVGGKLTTVSSRMTILTNRSVDWISVDPDDSGVLFSDRKSNTINKINAVTLDDIYLGDVSAEDLPVDHINDALTESRPLQPRILEIYNASSSQHVLSPSAVLSDGMRLFWLNSAPSDQSGELVQAMSIPKVNTTGAQTAPLVSPSGFVPDALASSRTHMFWSGENPSAGTASIFATGKAGGHHVYNMEVNLARPRGLAWDGDNTLFVADEARGNVYSMPVGKLEVGPPLTKAMALQGAVGVAVIFDSDIHLRK